MDKASKVVAWLCIFSTLLMGCYSSTLIAPTRDERSKMHSYTIEYIVMRDGRQVDFSVPPAACDTAIFYGQYRSVSIPVSDIVEVNSGGKVGVVHLDRIRSVMTKDGKVYDFASPPKVVDGGTILGIAADTRVSVPLSDVSIVCVSQFSYVKTGLLVELILVITVGLILIASLFPGP